MDANQIRSLVESLSCLNTVNLVFKSFGCLEQSFLAKHSFKAPTAPAHVASSHVTTFQAHEAKSKEKPKDSKASKTQEKQVQRRIRGKQPEPGKKPKKTKNAKGKKPVKKPVKKPHESTEYGKAKKAFAEAFLVMPCVWNCMQSVFTAAMPPQIQSAAILSRFQHNGAGRRVALEAAWLASEARSKVLEGMTESEKKRRRYK